MVSFLDLPDVEAAFADWRANKSSQRYIPKTLRMQVVTLLSHYKINIIRERLRLSGSQIAIFKQQAKEESDLLNHNDPFVMAQPIDAADKQQSNLAVEVRGANNRSMRIELNSVQQLYQLLPNLMEEL